MPNFKKSKSFQLRSGNKEGAPFKMMGSSPAKSGIFGLIKGLTGGGGSDGSNDLLFNKQEIPQAPEIPTVIPDGKSEKVKPQKIKIKDGAGGFTDGSTSSRPEDNATAEQRMGSDFVTKSPKAPTGTETKKAKKKDTMFRDTNKDGTKLSRHLKKTRESIKSGDTSKGWAGLPVNNHLIALGNSSIFQGKGAGSYADNLAGLRKGEANLESTKLNNEMKKQRIASFKDNKKENPSQQLDDTKIFSENHEQEPVTSQFGGSDSFFKNDQAMKDWYKKHPDFKPTKK